MTLLQRSPSYVFSLPAVDKLTAALVKLMPERWAYALARKRNIADPARAVQRLPPLAKGDARISAVEGA